MNHIHLTNDCLLGSCQWKGDLDIMNLIMIGIGKKLPPMRRLQRKYGNRCKIANTLKNMARIQ